MSKQSWIPCSLLLAAGCAFSPNPDKRNPALGDVAPLLSAAAIEVVAELPAPPGNLAVAADGTVFFTFHPEAAPEVHLARVTAEGYALFPDEGWQREREDAPFFVTPLALRIDGRGWLWVLDHGDYGSETPSLTAFDCATGELRHRFEFPSDVAGWGSMLNDFVVDSARDLIYIADPSPFEFDPALIVYDVGQRRARRLLENHDSVLAEDLHTVVQGRFMKAFGLTLQIDVDSIALSGDGEQLIYGPLSGGTLYRVPTAALRDLALDEEALAAQVVVHGPKPITDGIVADGAGNVYLTAIEHDALAVSGPDGELSLLVQDPELIAWPDGVCLGPQDAYLYATCSELHHVIGEDLEGLPDHAPFRIVRVPLTERSSPADGRR